MKVLREKNRAAAAPVLSGGGVAVLLTDTIYGLIGSAESEAACERVRTLKGRDADKAMIILAAGIDQLWGSVDADVVRRISESLGPAPTSIIVPASDATPRWLLQPDSQTIAFRLPKDNDLRELLRQTGPVVAPSANLQGQPPAQTIEEAIAYFGEGVDMYIDGGSSVGRSPSRLVRIDESGEIEKLR